jgi:hypothetical protein
MWPGGDGWLWPAVTGLRHEIQMDVRDRVAGGRLGEFQLVVQAAVFPISVVFRDDERAIDLDRQRAVEAERPAESGEVLGGEVAVSGDSSAQHLGQDRVC